MAIVIGCLLFIMAGLGLMVHAYVSWEIKNETQPVRLTSLPKERVRLKESETETSYISPVFKAKFAYNAIAPRWKGINGTTENQTMLVRSSQDSQNWTEWMEIEASGTLKDGDQNTNEMFGETPIFIEGRFFQVKSSISRESLDKPSPEIYDINVNYIDSREPKLNQVINQLGKTLLPAAKAAQDINIVSRQDWGNSDPYGTNFEGTDKYWGPDYSSVKQVILHHTVSPNYQSDPKAVMRAIYDYHANTLGWGDIGYNYVVDHAGTIYEGRYGGDNVIGGHAFSYNTGSMGVAVLGCFQSTSSTCKQLNGGTVTEPTASSLDSLSTLLSFKTSSYEINPNTQQTFCNYSGTNCLNLWTIAAHQDVGLTECNGDLFYNKLPSIRQSTADKNAQGWAYSAKQLAYPEIDIGYLSEVQATVSFKNTGTATWNNSTNPMTLRTAVPRDHTSPFQGNGWTSSSIAAVMNEASVAPGGTATFTFNLKYPTNLSGYKYEYFRLTATGIKDIAAHYGVHLHHQHEVARDFEILDGEASSTSGSSGDSGMQPATATLGGVRHVFYYDRANGDLKQTWKDDTGWHFATIDGVGGLSGQVNANVGITPAVTVFENKFHLLYHDATNGTLRYAQSDAAGTAWTFEVLDGQGGGSGRNVAKTGQSPAITVFNNGLQVFYYDSSNSNLRHAWRDSNGWHFENLDGDTASVAIRPGDVGFDPTATAYGDSLQLFYYDRGNGNLRHAWANSTGWHFENLDGDIGSIGRHNADSGHNPVVLDYGSLQLFYYDASHTNLRHAWADSTGWHFENLDGDEGSVARHTGAVGFTPTVAIAADGSLHISYYESGGASSGSLRYAHADSTGWHFDTVDGTGGLPTTRVHGNTGIDPAILPGISGVDLYYYDLLNGNLRLSRPR